MPTPFSAVILTFNEEINVGDCLKSAADIDDVFVLDSGSSDATVSIATARGARVHVNPFRSFGQQRNWAHENLPFAHDWILHLDADERLTPALIEEARSAVASDDGRLAGFYLAERTLLRGKWLRRAAHYPRYQARLVHRARMRFVDHGHGQRESSPLPFGTLANAYDHHAFSHGIETWLRKHAGYAARDVEQMLAAESSATVSFSALWSSDRVAAHRAVKQWAMRMPCRPLLRWLQVLILSGGLLDGTAGWEYARMMRVFQEMIDLCLREGRHRRALPGLTQTAGAAEAPRKVRI
jgi:glycosyltransferase involved in cell wall biosynthesis